MRSDTDRLVLRIAIGVIIGAAILVCLGVITVQRDQRRGQTVARLGEEGGEPGEPAGAERVEDRTAPPAPGVTRQPAGQRVDELPRPVEDMGKRGRAAAGLGPGMAADTEPAAAVAEPGERTARTERPLNEASGAGPLDAGYRPAAVPADSGLYAGADTLLQVGAVGVPLGPPEDADAATEPETPDAVPPRVEPGGPAAEEPVRPSWSRDENGLPPLAPADLEGSVVTDGRFEDPDAWAPLHRTEVDDSTDIRGGENYILWERTRSMDEPGMLGVYQDLQVKVSPAAPLVLSMDVLVDRDSVDPTRARLAGLETTGLAPVRVMVTYQGVDRRWYRWEHAFLAGRYDPLLFDLDRETGALSLKEGVALTGPVTTMAPGRWCRFEFDLMDDAARRDPATGVVYPKPAWVARISLYGTGWDFRGAAGNVALRPG